MLFRWEQTIPERRTLEYAAAKYDTSMTQVMRDALALYTDSFFSAEDFNNLVKVRHPVEFKEMLQEMRDNASTL